MQKTSSQTNVYAWNVSIFRVCLTRVRLARLTVSSRVGCQSCGVRAGSQSESGRYRYHKPVNSKLEIRSRSWIILSCCISYLNLTWNWVGCRELCWIANGRRIRIRRWMHIAGRLDLIRIALQGSASSTVQGEKLSSCILWIYPERRSSSPFCFLTSICLLSFPLLPIILW